MIGRTNIGIVELSNASFFANKIRMKMPTNVRSFNKKNHFSTLRSAIPIAKNRQNPFVLPIIDTALI